MNTIFKLHECLKNNQLITEKDSFLITGSFSVCCSLQEDMARFNNGQSDIDLIIVLKDKRSILHLLDDAQRSLFLNDKINLINYSFAYGKGRNQINIKYIGIKDFPRLMSFNKIQYKSYRKKPLTKYKPFEEFAASNLQTDKMYYTENYNNQAQGYILDFCYKPINNRVYRFSNIHSMLVTAIIGQDGCLIKNKHNKFLKKFLNIFTNLNTEQQKFLFSYFSCSKNWNEDKISKLIQNITKKI